MRTFFILLIIGLTLCANSQPAINGAFFTERTNYYDSNMLQSSFGIAACFDYSATPVIKYNELDTITSIKFNNEVLNLDHASSVYSKTNMNALLQQNWTVNGYGTIPSMNFLYSGVLPGFSVSPTIVSDTISISDTLFINLSGIHDADSVLISFQDDNQLPIQHTACYKASGLISSYYLPPAVFRLLTPGPRAVIKIDVINYNYQNISGKNYLFRNIFSYTENNLVLVN